MFPARAWRKLLRMGDEEEEEEEGARACISPELELWGWGTGTFRRSLLQVGTETPVPAEAAPRGCADLCADLS